jgi:hypothetical protein
MVQIYEDVPSGKSQFLNQLFGGAQQGFSKAMDFAGQIAQEKAKIKNVLKTYQDLEEKKTSRGKISEADTEQQEMEYDEDPYQEAIALELAGLHNLAGIEKERASQEHKQRLKMQAEEAKEERQRGAKLLERREQSRETLLQRKADYDIAEQAILQNPKDIGSLKNFASDVFHLPQLKTAPAAAFSAAMKDAFVNSIRAIPGARPNQWVEQQIQQAMARIGQSDEANLSAMAIGRYKLELEEAENQIIDEIEQEYEDRGQKFTGKASKEVFRRLKPIAEEKQFELAYKLKELQEKEMGIEKLQKNLFKSVSKGTPLTPRIAQMLLEEANGNEEKAIKAAQRLGYTIPTDQQLEKFGLILE